MNRFISFILSLMIALPSFVIPSSQVVAAEESNPQFNIDRECPNANCVDRLTGLLEAKIDRAKRESCLPPDETENHQEWYETRTHSAECFKLVKEIEEDIQRLERIQAHFSGAMLDDEVRMCREEQSNSVFNAQQLKQVQEATARASCTEAKKKEVWNNCASDASCVLISSSLSVLGPAANKVIPSSLRAKGCRAGQDNCLLQLATGFVKAVFSFFEGAWGLLKSAGKAIASGVANQSRRFWNWVTDAEDRSSTAQLSAAQASEEEGIFQQLKNDFSGTMARMWTGLMAALRHWMSNSVFCQKWSGTPQFSQCLQPAEGFGCTSCKAMITGMCALTGVLVAEVIPAFLTGGIVTIAKYGVSAASRVSKLVRVSATTTRAIANNSKLISMATKPAINFTKKVASSRFSQAGLRAMKNGLSKISRFLLRPIVVTTKKSLRAIASAARAGKTYAMMTPAGPVILYGQKALSTTVKVVLYPIENPLVVKSFQLGERFFDKIFAQAGKARFFSGVRPALTAEASRAMASIDDAYIEMRVTQYTRRHGSQYVTQAEEKYLKHLRLKRSEVIDDYLLKKPEIPFNRLIEDLYPDLKYGKYSKHLSAQDILKAEGDLLDAVKRMRDGPDKDRLYSEIESHFSSVARSETLAGSPSFTRPQVIENAKLTDDELRIKKAFDLIQVDPSKLSSTDLEKLKLGLNNAHEVGAGGVFNYKYQDISDKYKLLTEAGYTNRQAELLIRSGLAGKFDDAADVAKAIPLAQPVAVVNKVDEVVEVIGSATVAQRSSKKVEFNVDEILRNANLEDAERTTEALKLIKRSDVGPDEFKKLSLALKQAHEIGAGKNVFEYSWSELRQKFSTLRNGGFSREEAELLMRSGLAGRPPVRTLVLPGRTHFHSFAEDIAQGTYPKKYAEFAKRVKAEYSSSDAQKILDNYDSLFFIDYSHSSHKLLNMISGDQFKGLALSAIYDKKTFSNYRAARSWLLDNKPPVSKETLSKIHSHMMKGGVENVTTAQLGKIRNGEWYGNVPSGYEIDKITRQNILDNPYLTWFEGSAQNGLYTGQIYYPNVAVIRKEGLDLIRKSHPKTVKKVEEYQGLKKQIEASSAKYMGATKAWRESTLGKKLKAKIEELNKRQTELEKLRLDMNEELVDALVDQQFTWFNQQRAALGKIDDAASLDKFSNLVADFQRNLVSIHPLSNGNGRSTRELMYYLFSKEGLPPPRILDPNADIYKTAAEWRLMVKQGVLASDQLIEDLVERLKYGLPIEHSMQLLTPYTRPPYEMVLKGVKNKNMMEGLEYVDPRIYREIAYREMLADPKIVELMETDPTKAWDSINLKVKEVFEKNNLYYNHPKQGIERLELSFVDDDFLVHYGKPSFDNPELYAFKMRNWYSDQIVWRGLASKAKYADENEIINMFKSLNTHMASNSVLGKVSSRSTVESIRKAALEDFSKFNDDVFADGLVRMARDHSETGPLYGVSYGYSTSKNREVGKAFAMGAMVVGEYGAHKAPELQALLKSRILVGAQRANKDVDLGRLKQLRQDFSYKYPRQQEVMGIGASDPDSIRIIQTINADGSVALTYLRNPKKPNEIWVVKGDIDPNEVPSKDQIEKIIKLSPEAKKIWQLFRP